MKRTNCVNCGAAIDVEATKCPFCGTNYFDLTAVDLCSREPFALKMRVYTHDGKKAILTQLVVPNLNGSVISVHRDTIEGVNALGEITSWLTERFSTETVLSFTGIMSPENGTIYTLEIEE